MPDYSINFKIEVCVHCGRMVCLQVHHKNGDHNDNHEENLEYRCPSCHMQVERHFIPEIFTSAKIENEMNIICAFKPNFKDL